MQDEMFPRRIDRLFRQTLAPSVSAAASARDTSRRTSSSLREKGETSVNVTSSADAAVESQTQANNKHRRARSIR